MILMLEERMKAMATTQVSSYHWQHTASQYAALDAGGRGVLGTSPAPERPPIWSGDGEAGKKAHPVELVNSEKGGITFLCKP